MAYCLWPLGPSFPGLETKKLKKKTPPTDKKKKKTKKKRNKGEKKKKRSQKMGGGGEKKGKRKCISGFIIKNRLVKFETVKYSRFFCVFFFFFFFVGLFFLRFFFEFFFLHQFGGVTNKLQTKICQLCFTTQYSHGHTLPTARWQPPLNEETITPFLR